MRLNAQQIQAIHDTAAEMFGGGSRVDDSQRGGDLDLLDWVLANRPSAAARFAAKLQRRIGDRRIDVLIIDPETCLQPIHRVAQETGVAR